MGSYDKKLYEALGKKLRELRNEYKLSLEAVANRIGMTKKTIQRYELGEQRIPVENLKLLCDIYNYDIDKLNNEVNRSLSNEGKDHSLSPFGTDEEIISALRDDPDLLKTFNHVRSSDNLRILFDSTDGLTIEDLKPVLMLIHGIRKDKGLD